MRASATVSAIESFRSNSIASASYNSRTLKNIDKIPSKKGLNQLNTII